jgi:hypothetical protein
MGLTAMRNRETMPGMDPEPDQPTLEQAYDEAIDAELAAIIAVGRGWWIADEGADDDQA